MRAEVSVKAVNKNYAAITAQHFASEELPSERRELARKIPNLLAQSNAERRVLSDGSCAG